ncbi:unnamed protein product [Penicillium salamii]|uniref:Peptidase M24 domain-containing protein n=1 Tax=Penicillium salamii TaxID=1612424 RepID=A0A9W4IZB9_9EURO|nr:unnamed protein product [Penicillium salamii]CAG8389515.1 unnamed protein product [Penicillium salamii]CAG8407522.1 unnamed protein product [Penicillium salamii]CAG8413096.1 unnamed protein product [Penicillium salamii]
MANLSTEEIERASQLLNAQDKAIALFEEIENTLIRPGITEKTLNAEIYQLVIRSGPNTLSPFAENPPDRIIEEDDILVVDLGPVFEAWEADFGRTFVLGNDPHKLMLRDALEPIWDFVKARFRENPDMSGEELYGIACGIAVQEGFDFGADIAGHIVGLFPHERIPRDRIALYIIEGNKDSMGLVGRDGFRRHWILEIHLHDRERGFGGFFEKLLTID